MVNEETLSSVLSEFARTLITDFPIQRILDHFVQRVVDVLPISAAGVTLLSAGQSPHFIAASDESALRFERVQTELGHGPCLTAFETGVAVAIPDLRTDGRYEPFAKAAIEAGLVAVFTFPLCHGTGRIGALDLYRQTAGELDPHDMATAQTLADVAAAYLLNAQSRDDSRLAADRLYHSSLHDPLTGLANRLLLEERLEHAGHRAHRSHTTTAVLFADLDQFKQVNDTHGHHTGDLLLVAVADRLSGLVRDVDTLARFSGDEFVFLCEDLHTVGEIEMIANRIDAAFVEPFLVAGAELVMTASVGVAYALPDEQVSDQLIVNADLAMYQIKRKGGAGHQVIDVHEAQRSAGNVRLRADLRAAVAGSALDVAYQPIVRVDDGVVGGVEALLRWTHPERGPIPAITMVRLAERSGLINEIGLWILEQACRDHRRWKQHVGCTTLDLSVNVSVRQLLDPAFLRNVSDVLARTEMDPAELILEVTENILIENYVRCALVLDRLKALGLRLALDDFGTGYSSLSYLDRLPIDIVKIDRAFIARIGTTPASFTIVASIRQLASDLGLAVVAEGVETEFQRREIAALGCEYAQGYLYARPMPADAIPAYLSRGRPHVLQAASA